MSPGVADLRLLGSSKPDFSPIGVNTAWAKKFCFTEFGLAGHALEHDRRRGKLNHFSRSLIYDPLDSLQYAIFSATVPYHLDVERKTSIAVTLVHCRQDFFKALNLDQFTWLKIERGRRCGDQFSLSIRIGASSSERLNFVVGPDPDAIATDVRQLPKCRKKRPSKPCPKGYISRNEVSNIGT